MPSRHRAGNASWHAIGKPTAIMLPHIPGTDRRSRCLAGAALVASLGLLVGVALWLWYVVQDEKTQPQDALPSPVVSRGPAGIPGPGSEGFVDSQEGRVRHAAVAEQ